MTEKQFKNKVRFIFNNKLEVVGKFKNKTTKILVKDRYGLLNAMPTKLLNGEYPRIASAALNKNEYFLNKLKHKQPKVYSNIVSMPGKYVTINTVTVFETKFGIVKNRPADLLNGKIPSIVTAFNKTDYFMKQLYYKYPETANAITPISEYKTNTVKMLFDTEYGIVSMSPVKLLSGHKPSIKNAINRKDYLNSKLQQIYENKYTFDFINGTSDSSVVECTCPIHGRFIKKVSQLLQWSACPYGECKASNVIYFIKLINNKQEFYKIGISAKTAKGNLKRFKSYKAMGYTIDILFMKELQSYKEAVKLESEIKYMIKSNVILPIVWDSHNSTESFVSDDDLISKILTTLNS